MKYTAIFGSFSNGCLHVVFECVFIENEVKLVRCQINWSLIELNEYEVNELD